MSNYEVFILALICFFLGRWMSKLRKKMPRRKFIKEPLIKILYDPFDECWRWTKFNPKTRTWEWNRVATEDEVEKYKDVVLPEFEGMKIIGE